MLVRSPTQGMLFPRFRDILKVSSRLIAEVAEEMVREGLGKEPEDFTGECTLSVRRP